MVPAQILATNTPALSQMGKADGQMFGITILKIAILNLTQFFGEPWESEQLQECAEIAYSENYWLTLAELNHFTKKVKTLAYGKLYGKFAPGILMDYLQRYTAEMFDARADYFGKQKQSRNKTLSQAEFLALPADEQKRLIAENEKYDQNFSKAIPLIEKMITDFTEAEKPKTESEIEKHQKQMKGRKLYTTLNQMEMAGYTPEELKKYLDKKIKEIL